MNLSSSVGELPFVGTVYEKRLKKLDIKTFEDLLLHIPSRYLDFRKASKIKGLKVGEVVTVKGKVVSIKNIYTKSRKVMQEAVVKDSTGKISVTWFNQPYLVKNLHEGDELSLSGKVGFWGKKIALISPEYEKLSSSISTHTGRLVPIYPETAGVSSKWLRRQIINAYTRVENKLEEFLPKNTLEKLELLPFEKAVRKIHFPKKDLDITRSRKRLAFNELLLLQMNTLCKKKSWEKNTAASKLKIDKKDVKGFIDSLPFKLTSSQKRTSEEILKDLSGKTPMNRLLEGDVGSGKTVVAALAVFVAFINGKVSALMAPTQILAEQHFNTLNEILSPFKVRVKLITSSTKKGDVGKTDVFVGTHSLIHKKTDIEDLSLVVIDEQHRFGVEQRAHLTRKAGKTNLAPHVLTMTATPIPRTVALTLYGDLDLSTLDELPKGRKPITTWVVPPKKRESAYKWIEKEIKKNSVQAFVICPLIDESEKETMKQVKAAKSEYESIKKLLPELSVDLLHGKQKSSEKQNAVEKFKKGKTDILVSTPVVEVGIDVPNATIMLIEGADRFGLAQLHQLRGRVGRGAKKSYCLLFSEVSSKKAQDRLSALMKTMSGFELAELDLKLRGPGEVFGKRQHGFSELKIASWSDAGLIKLTRGIASEAFKDPKKYKKLHQKLKTDKIALN